jgi:hypothetical protein
MLPGTVRRPRPEPLPGDEHVELLVGWFLEYVSRRVLHVEERCAFEGSELRWTIGDYQLLGVVVT